MAYFNIDKLLEKNGKTRYWLAKEMGTDYNTVNKMFSNKARFIRLSTMDKLTEAFGCSVKDLFRDEP